MKAVPIVLAIAAVILVAGAATAYAFNPQVGFTVSADAEGNAVIDVNGALPADLTYRILDGSDRPDRIYIFLDEKYPGLQSYREQKRSLTTFEEMMSRRGYSEIEVIQVERLQELVNDPSAASTSGLVMTGGAIPDVIYPNDTDNGIRTWMANGGTLYWSGPDIGRFRDPGNGEECKDLGAGMFGDSVNYAENDPYLVTKASDISVEMGFAGERAKFGLRADYAGSRVLGLYGDYSSLSVLPVDLGRLYLFGTNFDEYDVEAVSAIADIVVCGITESTTIIDSSSLSKGYGDQSFSIGKVDPGRCVYVTSGSPVSAKGRLFAF